MLVLAHMDDYEICHEKINSAIHLIAKRCDTEEERAAVINDARALYQDAKPAFDRLQERGATAELSLEQLQDWSNQLKHIQSYFADQRLEL